MKDNLNIEELFQQKFEGFQANVSPDVWANIQAGIGGTAAATTGMTAVVKAAIISGSIIAASVTTWYFGFYEPEQNTVAVIENTNPKETMVDSESTITAPIIITKDQNDPLIEENKEKIERELLLSNKGDNKVKANGQNNPTNNPALINGSSTSDVSVDDKIDPVISDKNLTGDIKSDANPQDDKVKPTIPAGRMVFVQSTIYAPSQVQFSSNANNFSSVKWDFGDGSSAEGVEAKHSYTKPGKYVVTMQVIGETSSYEESQEVVIKSKSSIDNIPNVITPNGDRINDFFSINTTEIETFFISIRDNRGNEIFSSNDKEFIWDGTNFSGEVVEKGLYNYIIIAEGKDGGVFKIPGQIYVQ